jgi:SAM-dependent methyltransferase
MKKMDPETDFFSGLIELFYGEKVEDKLKYLSKKVSWAKDWPKNDVSFWNAESFLWGCKISKETRGLISRELKFLSEGQNLDLGCGAYSYLSSVCFDFSEKMLKLNDNCIKSVSGNLEHKLPFKGQEFDSVTAIFVLNYIRNYSQLFLEIQRVLNKEGIFVMVLGAKGINDWQKQKEVNDFDKRTWTNKLKDAGFNLRGYRKENLLFFVCKKQKDY